jgi:DNA-binding CsgD family transcriptional regulator
LHRETHGEPDRSPRYRRIHRSLGFGAELRAVFRTGDAIWGSVALVRDEGQPDFSDEEVAFVSRIGGHIAHGLREALLRETTTAAGADRAPGVIVLARDGSVRSLSEQAAFWLERFPDDRGTGLGLPAAVYAVSRRASASGAPPDVRPHATVRLTSGEWLTVHASPLHASGDDDAAVAVTLTPAAVTELEPLRLALYGLTGRERQVAQLLARGATNEEIARALWISRHTVKDHAKAVYAKLGVASRAELSAKLFYEHVGPSLGSDRVRDYAADSVG